MRTVCLGSRNYDWPSLLPHVEFSVNNSPIVTLKKSPFKIALGYSSRCHLGNQNNNVTPLVTLHDPIYARRLRNSDNMKSFANRKPTESQEYTVNDFVWLDTRNLYFPRRGKLDPLFIRPFRVLERFADTVKQDLPRKLARIHGYFHVLLLRKACGFGEGHGVMHLHPQDLFAEGLNARVANRSSQFKGNALYSQQ
jgi:hypothetical protein